MLVLFIKTGADESRPGGEERQANVTIIYGTAPELRCTAEDAVCVPVAQIACHFSAR